MSEQPALKPRKTPRHARSRATVEAILEAAAHLLQAKGYARLTTNHVAEAAGVSIGSLYQYFPNKESICHALAEQHFEEFTRRYLESLDSVAGQPLEAQVRALVRVGVEIVRDNAAFSGNLYPELGSFGGLDPVRASRQKIIEVLKGAIEALPDSLRPADPEITAYIVTVSCGQLIGEAAIHRPAWLNDPEFENQICQLVLGYYNRLGWT